MRFVGKSKIGRLSAKKGRIYAQIRLPPTLADTIGDTADVYETERNGKRAFMLVTDKSVIDYDTVLQPSKKVVKLDDETDSDRRFKALEFQISELKSLLLLNESASLHENKNRWARPNSNRRPSPCKGDVIIDRYNEDRTICFSSGSC